MNIPDNDLSKIILGTVQLGIAYGINNSIGQPSFETAFKILNYAYENGVTTLDTAEAYGKSQEVIGAFHRKSGKKFKVISKLHPSCVDAEAAGGHINKMIEILNVESLEACMLHHFNVYKKHPELINCLEDAQKKGLINKIGVSVYTNAEIDEICCDDRIDVVQLPFNLLDNCRQREAGLQKLKANHKEVHVRSVFLQGLFFKADFRKHTKLQVLEPYIAEIHRLCSTFNISVTEMALKYAISNKYLDKVLVGVESERQLAENLQSVLKNIPESYINAFDQIDVKETEMLNPVNWQ